MKETIDIESNPELMPAVRREPGSEFAVDNVTPPGPITAAQAKVEAVAALTMKAYEKASTLDLTDGEIAALQEDFPDEAFLTGAGGKADLIYCQHSYLRDRLNKVFRPGQWSIVPRNRWAEDFTTQGGKPASRVYVEAMLIIRGCFVAEAVGEMEYYPNNASQNYGDAVEGAKTAALRRCCKELGIGLQAWKKEWCDAWWQRKRGQKPSHNAPVAPTTSQKPSPHIQTPLKSSQVKPEPKQAEATPEQRQRMIDSIMAGGNDYRDQAIQYFIEMGAIMPNEGLESVPLRWVPTMMSQNRELGMCFTKLEIQGKAEKPSWLPGIEPEAKPPVKTSTKPHVPGPSLTGEIEIVTIKEGVSKQGAWTLYGIKINGVFHNTFDHKLGRAAKEQTGNQVTLFYTDTAKGKAATDLIINGKSVFDETPAKEPESGDDLVPF